MSLLNDFKGWSGELQVGLIQWWYLDKRIYHMFKNIFLPILDGGTTQIDHVIVSVL